MSGDGPTVEGGREKSARRSGYHFGPPSAGGSSSLLSFVGSRWKLWGCDGAVEISHNDPDELYTIACWGATASSSSGVAGCFMALGCQSGRVQVWNPISGEPLGPIAVAFAALARGSDCAVTSLAASQPGRSSVFAGCRGLPEVLELGLFDGATRRSFKLGKVGVMQLATSCSGAEWLLSADLSSASSLRLWALSELSTESARNTPVQQRATARLAGPANSPTSVDVCSVDSAAGQGGRALAICADGTMQVDVFSCSGSTSASSTAPLNATLALSSREPVQVAHFVGTESVSATEETRLTVVGYGPSSVVLWNFRLSDINNVSAKSAKGRTVSALLAVGVDELGGRVLCARFSARGAVAASAVVVAFGHGAKPSFSTARLSGAKGKVIVESCSAAEPTQQERKKHVDAAATPLSSGGSVVKSQPTVLGPMQATVARRRPEKRQILAADGEEKEAKRAKQLPVLSGKQLPTAVGLSIAPVVRQGLKSGESQAIEKVLGNNDKKVLDSTVSELSGTEAFDLLQECTKRLVSAPLNGIVICNWVQSILTRHCAFIRSQPALRSALEPLHDALQQRNSLHRTLVRLRGRLQLLRDLGKQNLEATQKERDTLRTPLLEYIEGDEDNVDEDSDAEDDDEEEEESECSGINADDIWADDDSED